jgi:ornithine cyclodeaminase/alanine dehydrogenase-like protein (mu-crystallin family)
MKILNWEQIKNALQGKDLVESQEQGFLAYSQNRVEMPPVGHLNFNENYGMPFVRTG